MDLELSATCYHDAPRTYNVDAGEIACGQCGVVLQKDADPCQQCSDGKLHEFEVDGVKLCWDCYQHLSDDGQINSCEQCGDEHYGEDEFVVMDDSLVCRNCYRKLALAGEVGPGWLPLVKAMEWDTLRKAPYLHFTYVVGQLGVPEGNKLVLTDFFDAITGSRWGQSPEDQCRDLLAEAKKAEPNWRRREYLVLLDRSTHNVCALGMDLLSRPRKARKTAKVA